MENRIEKTFATPEGCDLVVENISGEIKVEGWDRPDTQIVAVQREGQGDVEITQEGRRVVARTKSESNILAWIAKWRVLRVDYTVHVPWNSNVTVKNVTGPIHVAHVTGEVRVNNVDGSTNVEAVTGEINAETVNGTLSASALQGKARLSTVNGQMRVRGDTLDSLKASTVNGSIQVAAALAAQGHYNLHTVNGSCQLSVPADFRARVFAQGINLSVSCQTPSQSINRKLGSWEGVIGTGDGPLAEVRFETVNGSLRIDNHMEGVESAAETAPFVAKTQTPMAETVPFVAKTEAFVPDPRPEPRPEPKPEPEPAPFQAKVAPSEAEPRPSQLEILQKVESGELGVEEAVKLLQK